MKNLKVWEKCMWAGMALLFGGLVVMLAGMAVEKFEHVWGMIILLSGLGVFVVGSVFICVSCIYGKKNNQKQQKAQENSLLENQILLNGYIVGTFTEEGFVYWDREAQEVEQKESSESLICYRIRKFRSPNKKGEDKIFLKISENQQTITGFKEIFSIDERSLSIAERYGVKIVEKIQPDNENRRKVNDPVNRGKHSSMRVVGTVLLIVLVFAALIGLTVWLRKLGIPSSIIMGVFAVAIPLLFSSGALAHFYNKQSIIVYEDGIYIVNKGKCFLPMDYIERVIKSADKFIIDVGYCIYPLDDKGVYSYLKKHFPEKCKD